MREAAIDRRICVCEGYWNAHVLRDFRAARTANSVELGVSVVHTEFSRASVTRRSWRSTSKIWIFRPVSRAAVGMDLGRADCIYPCFTSRARPTIYLEDLPEAVAGWREKRQQRNKIARSSSSFKRSAGGDVVYCRRGGDFHAFDLGTIFLRCCPLLLAVVGVAGTRATPVPVCCLLFLSSPLPAPALKNHPCARIVYRETSAVVCWPFPGANKIRAEKALNKK